MANRYVVFDVETPNYANNRMSAIGVTIIEDGFIAEEKYSLINPEARFDAFNVSLTGITPDMVADQPTFPEFWELIGPIMDSGLLIAHNAPFDMGVLAKCLNFYNISWRPVAYYACTCAMGRACYPELPNHRLNTLCAYLDIHLDHHHAGSDSRACAGLLLDYVGRGICVEDFVRSYDMAAVRTIGRGRFR